MCSCQHVGADVVVIVVDAVSAPQAVQGICFPFAGWPRIFLCSSCNQHRESMSGALPASSWTAMKTRYLPIIINIEWDN